MEKLVGKLLVQARQEGRLHSVMEVDSKVGVAFVAKNWRLQAYDITVQPTRRQAK